MGDRAAQWEGDTWYCSPLSSIFVLSTLLPTGRPCPLRLENWGAVGGGLGRAGVCGRVKEEIPGPAMEREGLGRRDRPDRGSLVRRPPVKHMENGFCL